MGAAGVLTNLLLAILFACIAREAFSLGLTLFGALAASVVFVNLSLGLFNLIPIPPLDGYTVFRGILPIRFSWHEFLIQYKYAYWKPTKSQLWYVFYLNPFFVKALVFSS